jgi:hypothetical protein
MRLGVRIPAEQRARLLLYAVHQPARRGDDARHVVELVRIDALANVPILVTAATRQPAAHPIESRAAPLRPQPAGPVPAMNWRPAAVGIFTALMVFLAMLVLGR